MDAIEILKNQVVIMQALRRLLVLREDKEELIERIRFTEARIKALC
jgi:hypothetical protein